MSWEFDEGSSGPYLNLIRPESLSLVHCQENQTCCRIQVREAEETLEAIDAEMEYKTQAIVELRSLIAASVCPTPEIQKKMEYLFAVPRPEAGPTNRT